MDFAWSNGVSIANVIINIVLIVILLLLVFYVLFKSVKRKIPLIIYGFLATLIIVSYILALNVVCYMSVALLAVDVLISLFVNLGDLRKFLSNPFKVVSAKPSTYRVEKIVDRDAINKEIEKAVISLSKSKTGAIITFERSNSLADIIKNGVMVNAPISAELLVTIFYPGTRLHDGAVVIHGNEIVAASVFFTPTTKAFAGKYGSRHRAAVGISEISDAITVVVSEETGRISLAYNGTLEVVDQTNFLRVFENLLNDRNK